MRSGKRQLTDYEMRMDALGENFDTVYSTLMRDREKQVSILSNQEANVWSRKRALCKITEIDKACKALVNIMGAMEDACEEAKTRNQDFLPVVDSEVA